MLLLEPSLPVSLPSVSEEDELPELLELPLPELLELPLPELLELPLPELLELLCAGSGPSETLSVMEVSLDWLPVGLWLMT